MGRYPAWVTKTDEGLSVDCGKAYPRYLEQLRLEETRYSCGVVKEIICRDLVERYGEGLTIRFRGDRDTWSDAVLPGKPGDHDRGMREAHRYRRRLLEMRAAKAGLE